MTSKMKTFYVKKQYDGYPSKDNFKLVEEDIPAIKDGEVLVESLYLSVDPYMRAFAQRDDLPMDQKMFGTGSGRVVKSKHSDYPVGTVITGGLGWSTHIIIDPKTSSINDPFFKKVPEGMAPSHAMSVFGLTGLTAYFGLLDICSPKEGETVFVNAAAGAVGSFVGQIAKIKGCRVVGCAGSDEKLQFLKEIGFDGVFNYKTTKNLKETLKELCPDGIDCFFENVGGEMFGVVLDQMTKYGRIAMCGAISVYNEKDPEKTKGVNIHLDVIFKELKVQGFIVTSYKPKFPEGIKQLSHWIEEGKIKVKEDIIDGFEAMPKALMDLFTGQNTGKLIVKV